MKLWKKLAWAAAFAGCCLVSFALGCFVSHLHTSRLVSLPHDEFTEKLADPTNQQISPAHSFEELDTASIRVISRWDALPATYWWAHQGRTIWYVERN